MPRPPTLVCFDLGGVVLRICRTWAEGCAAVGLDLRGDAGTQVDERLRGGANGFDELNHAYQRGRIDEAAFASGFSALIDGLYSPEEIVRVHRSWIRGTYDGIDDVVAALHAADVETAVLSNTCLEHWDVCRSFEVIRSIPHLHASHLIDVCKPDAGAYRAVERTTGRAGADILFFDDLAANVDAARALGWRAERIDPHGDTAVQVESHLVDAGVLG